MTVRRRTSVPSRPDLSKSPSALSKLGRRRTGLTSSRSKASPSTASGTIAVRLVHVGLRVLANPGRSETRTCRDARATEKYNVATVEFIQ